jgi:hypothetical protein
MQKTLFDTLETSHFQQLKELSSTPQTFNESKNSLPHTFTLKLDTFKKLEEIFSTPPTHLEMDFYSLCNLAN